MTPTIEEDCLLIEQLRKRYDGFSLQEVKDDLRDKYTEAWDEEELAQKFVVLNVDGPTVHVVRKADNAKGTVGYIDSPRVYFAFLRSADD